MRRQSKKTAKMYRTHRASRKGFLALMKFCWACGLQSSEVHEMVGGSSRQLSFVDRKTWFASCNDCNFHRLTDSSIWPLERQLAAKLVYDAEYFDVVAVNRIRGRADNSITLADVARYLDVAWQQVDSVA